MNAWQLRLYVVRPVLYMLELWSREAEEIVLATAAQESGLTYIRQLGGGPARGLWQIEPATAQDIWDNYLDHRPQLAGAVRRFMVPGVDAAEQLIGNLYYGAAMCRVFYRRLPDALPPAEDVRGMAELWKRRYNTALGKGTVEEFVAAYERLVARRAA